MSRMRLATIASASLVAAALTVPLTAATSSAAPQATGADSSHEDQHESHVLRMPWQEKYDDLRKQGIEQRLRQGGSGSVERVGRGAFARVAETGTDRVFVVLAEFGQTSHSAFPAGESDAQRTEGPLHNEIPEPDRSVDNSTLWEEDYDQSYFEDMYFNRMRTFYEEQSLGTYSVDGDVTEWVKVPFNQARYGRDLCGSIACDNTWFLVRDALAVWTQGRLDSGWSMQRIQDYLKTFDVQDRYDFDEDGDFDEPDGYIDHFQVVHAGGDQADGDPVYGEDAIWSHRWYAQVEPVGTGPQGGGQFGGVDIGSGGVSDPDGAALEIPDNPTGVWVGDYTIQPENGGLSVFAHEFAHDLGLPDLYDTSGNTGGAENSTGFWTLMSQSRGTARKDAGIGDRPMPFGAWEKFQLGWLDYDVARAGRSSKHFIRPGQSTKGKEHNALMVLLPDKEVTTELGDPCATCGGSYYFSGSGNDLDTTMTREVEGGGELAAQVRYSIEDGWDYAFLEVTTDGETWESIPTSVSYAEEDQGGANPDGTGISGTSDGWVDLTATVPAEATAVRFRYLTDVALALPGFQVDEITLDGESIGTAEGGPDGWSLDGFTTTDGTQVEEYLNAYLVDNRQYVGRDKLLKSVYHFGDAEEEPTNVDLYRQGAGALISYWDTSFTDNNVGDHPGGGLVLPVDAHPEFVHTPDGDLARPRTSSFDAAFGLTRTKKQVIDWLGEPFELPAIAPVRTFDDTLDWWFDGDEHGTDSHPGRYQQGWSSVDVPKTGTTITVKKVKKNGVMVLKVGRSS
ncbi:immune inhibitor A domain-containing protein [Nocardioides ginkgobilobae]